MTLVVAGSSPVTHPCYHFRRVAPCTALPVLIGSELKTPKKGRGIAPRSREAATSDRIPTYGKKPPQYTPYQKTLRVRPV